VGEAFESMAVTQSPDLMRELKSQAHEDRGWLIEALEAAAAQNEELAAELGRLEVAVDQLGAPRPKRSKAKEE
jgi:hypothetical protein